MKLYFIKFWLLFNIHKILKELTYNITSYELFLLENIDVKD